MENSTLKHSSSKNNAPDSSEADLTQLIHDLRGSICSMISAMRVIDLQTKDQQDVQEMVAIAMRGFDESNIFVEQLQKFAERLIEQNMRLTESNVTKKESAQND